MSAPGAPNERVGTVSHLGQVALLRAAVDATTLLARIEALRPALIAALDDLHRGLAARDPVEGGRAAMLLGTLGELVSQVHRDAAAHMIDLLENRIN